MRLARQPSAVRALLCMVALALLLASTLGLVHRTVHSPGAPHAQAVAMPAQADAQGHATHEGHSSLVALFGYHTDADCRLYDQLAHGPAALCVPAGFLPVTLPAATFAYLQGEAIARWVALFDARGPPSTR